MPITQERFMTIVTGAKQIIDVATQKKDNRLREDPNGKHIAHKLCSSSFARRSRQNKP